MKKFYTLVSTRADQGGWLIELDGKPVRTPSGALLRVPVMALADAVAQEWSRQQQDIVPDTMPLTQIMVTALDRVAREREVMQETTLSYFDTDLLCYRASEPPELVRREGAARDPWLHWFESVYGMALTTTTGLMALHHGKQAHFKARQAVLALDLWAFTVLQMVTALTGSLVLALAFVVGQAQPEDLLRALYVEEDYKADIYDEEFYGRAPHQERAMQGVERDLRAGQVFLEALGLKKA
ncbi:MAG: ATP12 chaperone family protein [Micavibrio aeruginosavorus]|uniref:ATP12 chaperone family protein n=1 Tax=Micavibrio aeruginosavorus TaxID=349221 RepID=A0A7T5UHN5_9BACT|nr:MAG: ATP12 chaperone family protein [Micavibrio aeruginosavorus]